MTFLPIHVWIALSFEKETKPLPDQGVISMKSCEMEPKLRADWGGSKRGTAPGPQLALQQAGQPLRVCWRCRESWESSAPAKSQASGFNVEVGI